MNLEKLSPLLKKVEKPAQYLGNEVNSIHKAFDKQSVRVALVFPDLYEMGMSHMGLKILYEILNQMEGVVAERCFAPALDYEKELRNQNLDLCSLESKTPLKEFDLIGISLPYELTYTNILNIIDLAGLPLLAKDRNGSHPIILGGGTGSYNPEPIADFFDGIAIGDGEELIVEVTNMVKKWKQEHSIDFISKNQNHNSKETLIDELKNIEGIYIPKYFDFDYNPDGTIKERRHLKEDYSGVKKRIVNNLDEQTYPTKVIVPNTKLIHDRIGIEIQRGCTRMCRFCQAGYIERPTRQRAPETVLNIAEQSLQDTGIEEISLLSLSAGDYQTIVPTVKELNNRYLNKNISISVPATRTETLTDEMVKEISRTRKTGFTIAPEAGSERMRRVINKGNKLENLMQACRNAFSNGYRLIKFYYMCGLPFERDEDLIGIANEAYEAWKVGREYNKKIDINVSVSSFVPKPFTPFQWQPQNTTDEVKRKHHVVKSHLKNKFLHFKCHKPEMSFLEGLFARGDRRLSKLLMKAFEKGCRFDEWGEFLRYDLWQEAIEETQTDVNFYLHRERDKNEILPWDHLFIQMQKDWLWKEFESAKNEAYVADCSVEKCAQFCGVCDFKTVKNKIFVIDDHEIAAKKGNREWTGRFGDHTQLKGLIPQKFGNHLLEAEKTNSKCKVRANFQKTGFAAYFSHLELMSLLKRAILKTDLKPAFSIGYHPHMKLSMGYALPLGMESLCESFDLVLEQHAEPYEIIEKINKNLPMGLCIQSIDYIDLNSPSIYSITKAIDYEVELSDEQNHLLSTIEKNLDKFNKGEIFQIIRSGKRTKRKVKKEKTFLLNDFLKLTQKDPLEEKSFKFRMTCAPNGMPKPSEVIGVLSGAKEEELSEMRFKKVGYII